MCQLLYITHLGPIDTTFISIQKIFIWSTSFPAPTWFYFSSLLLKKPHLKPVVIIGFVSAFVIWILGVFTNLILNYSQISSTNTKGIYLVPPGKLYWLLTSQIILLTSIAAYNFYTFTRTQVGDLKIVFRLVTITSVLFTLAGAYLALNYTFGRFYPETPGEVLLTVGVIIITYAIIRYSHHVEVNIFSLVKDFIISTLVIFGFYSIYLTVILLINFEYSFKFILLLVVGAILIPLTHSSYDWVMSFVRNIFHQRVLEIPKVTDGEVLTALRSYNKPAMLENSGLLRLKLLDKTIDNPDIEKIIKLKRLLKEAVEYFCPDDLTKRTKTNIKYQSLKLMLDQVEEGQMLWDLGFEEYPLDIAEKAAGKSPRFAIESPIDYQAISRNAFLNLKKEAIHDLAWRISYLERRCK